MEKENKVRRYYLGVDWADEFHQVWVSAAEGKKVAEMTIEQSMKGLSEFGRWLHGCKGEGIELWAAIEKPPGTNRRFSSGPRSGGLSGQSQGAGSGQRSLSHEPIQE